MSTPAFISGIGSVSCAGSNVDALWHSVLHEQTAIQDGFGRVPVSVLNSLYQDLSIAEGSMSSPALLAIASAQQAMNQAGWTSLNEEDGLIVATTAGQISLWESELVKFARQQIDMPDFKNAIRHQSLGSVVEPIAKWLKFTGRSMVIASACSAATQALALAAMWIAQGRVKRCLVGGTEVLSQLTIEGFRSLQLLSPSPSTPFDQHRHGINLSEGAAFFCLERENSRALVKLSGYGLSTDAYHMASPHPEGKGSYAAMDRAILGAGLAPSDIDWVHAHGTGSKANDQAEGTAIRNLFGAQGPMVTSTKWVHGHALGASGALETAICAQAIRHQKIPRTGGLQIPDPAIPIRHPQSTIQYRIRHVVKNTLGFGGSNAALVLSEVLR